MFYDQAEVRQVRQWFDRDVLTATYVLLSFCYPPNTHTFIWNNTLYACCISHIVVVSHQG